jgi:hypothetical protein
MTAAEGVQVVLLVPNPLALLVVVSNSLYVDLPCSNWKQCAHAKFHAMSPTVANLNEPKSVAAGSDAAAVSNGSSSLAGQQW